MKFLPLCAVALVVVGGAPAVADTIGSCAELTDKQSPHYNPDRDSWWRYTDARGISCAQGSAGMSDDSDATDDDEAPPPPRRQR